MLAYKMSPILPGGQWDDTPRYWLRDCDQIDGTHVRQRVRHMEIAEVIIAPNSP
jgi:hypothetical protein